jgi:hypothetical protein
MKREEERFEAQFEAEMKRLDDTEFYGIAAARAELAAINRSEREGYGNVSSIKTRK